MAQPTFTSALCTNVETVSGASIPWYRYTFEAVTTDPIAGTTQFVIDSPLANLATLNASYSTLNPTPA